MHFNKKKNNLQFRDNVYFIRRNFRERNFREVKNSRIFLDKLSRMKKLINFREINFREWRNFLSNLGHFLENKGIFCAENWQNLVLKIIAKFRDINFREWAILNFSRDKLSRKGVKFAKFAKVSLAKVSPIKVDEMIINHPL